MQNEVNNLSTPSLLWEQAHWDITCAEKSD